MKRVKALKKEFPEHFIAPAVHLLRDLSLSGDPTVLGSGSDRAVLYSADLDAMDTAPLTPDTPARFKEKIQHLEGMKDVRIGDIKSGILPEWNILEEAHVTKGKVLGYNAEVATERLDALKARRIITEAEYKESIRLLKPKPSPLELLIAQKAMRFGIVRWTPKDVKAGFVKLRDGTTLGLYDAMKQKTITKVDVVTWMESRFVECEMVYLFTLKGKPIVTLKPPEVRQGLKESLLIYAGEGNWMKVAKRLYSLARQDEATTIQANLREVIFNSDYGRLYSILSDAETLKTLEEEGITKEEKEHVKQETDGFRARLALVTLPPFIKPIDPFSADFIEKVRTTLQTGVKKALVHLNLLPIPGKWRT